MPQEDNCSSTASSSRSRRLNSLMKERGVDGSWLGTLSIPRLQEGLRI